MYVRIKGIKGRRQRLTCVNKYYYKGDGLPSVHVVTVASSRSAMLLFGHRSVSSSAGICAGKGPGGGCQHTSALLRVRI